MAHLAAHPRSRLRCSRALVCSSVLLERCATVICSGRLFVMFAGVAFAITARARGFVVPRAVPFAPGAMAFLAVRPRRALAPGFLRLQLRGGLCVVGPTAGVRRTAGPWP
jgi:hypothetical protein